MGVTPSPRRLARVAFFAIGLCIASSAAAFFESNFEQRFFLEEASLVTDHSLVYVEGDGYHLFYAIGISGEGWMHPGNMVDFGHATSPDLITWTLHPRVLSIDVTGWKNRNLFAPHVVPDPSGSGYLMYYTGVDSTGSMGNPVETADATGIAHSLDLYNWVDLSVAEPAYHPDSSWAVWQHGQRSNGRDPVTLPVDGGVILLSTATASPSHTGSGELGALSLAESPDGLTFTDVGGPLLLNDTFRVLESPGIHRRPNLYFLFYHESGISGIYYMTSPTLFTGWDKSSARQLDLFAFGSGDVVNGAGGQYFSRVIDADLSGGLIYGAKFDPVEFTSDSVAYGSTNTLWDQWWIVEGDAFDTQPTFGDRPYARGESESGIDGYFSINSAEVYDGPLGLENPANPPDYAATGKLRSVPFTITGDTIDLLVAGGDDPDLAVNLVRSADQVVLESATGTDSHRFSPVNWDVAPHWGTSVYFEVIDNLTDSPLGFIAVDAIREYLSAGATAVAELAAPASPAIRLGAPSPNPVAATTFLPLELAHGGEARLGVYDVQGRARRALHAGYLAAGAHRLAWDGRDAAGRRLAAGVYFLRLDVGGTSQVQRVLVSR